MMKKVNLLNRILIFVILTGVFMKSRVNSCTAKHKRQGDSAVLQYQATTLSSEDPLLAVSNVIKSPNDSTLLNALYLNGKVLRTPVCNSCTFTGDATTGNLAIRLDNLQASNGGTYQLEVDGKDNPGECITLFILNIPTKPVITKEKDPPVGESVILTCTSTSTTTPSNHGLKLKYKWRVDGTDNPSDSRYSYSTNKKTFILSNVVKEDAKKNITCTVTEDVDAGYTSSSSDSVFLNVLYPPDGPPEIQGIGNDETYKVLDNTKALISCVVKGGNPLATLSWNCYNEGGPSAINGKTVTKNVTWVASRGQERACTCQSTHEIAGKQTVSVRIQVLYLPSIVSFFIKGREGQDHVIVNEHDDFQLICTVDSKPESVVKLIFEGRLLQEVPETNTLTYTHKHTACLDAGFYTCEGTNGLGEPPNVTLALSVRCSPRPLHQIKENFTSPSKLPVTLSFMVLAYPEPGPSGYKWHKHDSTRWIPLLSNADLLISSSGLQSNLTIVNVSKSDFGQYRLTIVNSLGTYEQYLFLKEIQDYTPGTSFSESTNDTGNDNTHTDDTTIIVGVALGVLCFALVIYAAIVTVLWKRKTSKKGRKAETSNKSLTQTTYANLGFETNVSEDRKTAKTDDKKGGAVDSERQYMSLDPLTKNDNAAYDVIQTH